MLRDVGAAKARDLLQGEAAADQLMEATEGRRGTQGRTHIGE